MTRSCLYLNRDMRAAELTELSHGTAAVCSARCPTKSGPNEDAAAVIGYHDGATVLAVADGVGGEAAGEQAARVTLEALDRSLQQASDQQRALRGAILDGIELANREVQQLGVGAATTLAVVELADQHVRPYHVGDSMVIVTGQRGRLKLRTISHSPVGYALESGMLDHDQAMHHDQRHVVSNVIGASDMRIEIGSAIRLAPRDTLLIASDGLLDNLHLDEIVDIIRKGALAPAVERLLETAHHRMLHQELGPSKPDDLTLVAYRL